MACPLAATQRVEQGPIQFYAYRLDWRGTGRAEPGFCSAAKKRGFWRLRNGVDPHDGRRGNLQVGVVAKEQFSHGGAALQNQ